MAQSNISKQSILIRYQFPISIIGILIVSYSLFYTVHFWGYRIPALVLLMVVSLYTLLFDIYPVLTSAALSALIWNFFFIPPVFTLHIANGEDGLMFLMYFIIALVHTILSFKIKQAEKVHREKEEKEKQIKLYNTLLNSLSHELKTPIATIIGAVDTIRENKNLISENNQNELLMQISKAGIRLNKEVENLLNMSRLESGVLMLKIDWCDLNELINLVLSKFDNQEVKQSIYFEQNDDFPLVKIDSVLMEQVLYNIINNAIIYTNPDSDIYISISMEEEITTITIRDNGPGFSPEEQSKIFDMFYRLPHNKAGGSGLGLSIAKGFVEAHNGKIELHSQKGLGSRFVIHLPVETSYIKNIKNE